ncbi:MAG: SAM-dependent methyltransferase, partial [Xanthomonadales bacterium]|nr:SAM-dependent methyltransferase [Xanthomonadales bacterium]
LAVISAAILAYEVLLVRLFAIVQWHHFAFMAISVALLGFGISGAFLAVCRPWAERHSAWGFTVAAAAFGLTAPVAFLLAQSLPFNALAVIWTPSQLLYLGVIYVLLAVPFTAGAACIGLAFLEGKAEPGRVYLWNLVGSGVGALGVLAPLSVLPPMTCLALAGALGFAASFVNSARHSRLRGPVLIAALAGAAGAAWTLGPPAWTSLRISEFKGQSQSLGVHGAEIVAQRSGPLALLSVIESPSVPFRFAPGLSLQSPALPPEQLGIFADGEFVDAINLWDGRPERLIYLGQSTDALAYSLTQSPELLVLNAGGGRTVLQAIAHGAAGVFAVERNPDLHRVVAEDFAARAAHPFARPEVTTRIADARHFLTASAQDWDLIVYPYIGGDPGGSLALTESYLHTIEAEAFRSAYSRLRPDGWLSITSRVELPPRILPKLLATLRAALDAEGMGELGAQLIAIRGITTVTVLVKRGAVSAAEIAQMKAFAEARAFDLVHYPGMTVGEANRRNVLESPVYFQIASTILGGQHLDLIESYKFDITPATDDRPYFFDFFRWSTLPELLALGPVGGAALLELGELIVLATLVQALVLSLLLVLLPLRAGRFRPKPQRTILSFGGYFLALGLAFMFIEIAWIQKFILFVGHPLYAVSVALAGFLVFAGIGAALSARLERYLPRVGALAIGVAVLGIAATALGYLAILPPLFEALATLSDAMRIAVALAMIAPLAFFMGMPFPL